MYDCSLIPPLPFSTAILGSAACVYGALFHPLITQPPGALSLSEDVTVHIYCLVHSSIPPGLKCSPLTRGRLTTTGVAAAALLRVRGSTGAASTAEIGRGAVASAHARLDSGSAGGAAAAPRLPRPPAAVH